MLHLQDATFGELLRRLQKLEVDPQLPAEVTAAYSGGGAGGQAAASPRSPSLSPRGLALAQGGASADDAPARIQSICQSRPNIAFEAVLDIIRQARITKVGCFESPAIPN